MQALVPIQEHNEFGFNIVEICDRLNERTDYVGLTKEAFETEMTPFALTRALATFERTLISGNSPYDKYTRGEGSLTASELNGMELFNSNRTNCSSCHTGFNFTDYSFRNNGYESGDIGRMRLTLDSSDYSIMKVASLRNVALSAPYMHDGSFSTLRQVIDQYNAGGNSQYKDPLIKPLSLTEFEIEDLISFLNSLTDQTFISNENFQE
jgi:cytochrome c peroxidase